MPPERVSQPFERRGYRPVQLPSPGNAPDQRSPAPSIYLTGFGLGLGGTRRHTGAPLTFERLRYSLQGCPRATALGQLLNATYGSARKRRSWNVTSLRLMLIANNSSRIHSRGSCAGLCHRSEYLSLSSAGGIGRCSCRPSVTLQISDRNLRVLIERELGWVMAIRAATRGHLLRSKG